MSQDQQTNDTASIPCSQGCGFFGCASHNNMCSKCYKEHCARNGEIVKKMDLTTTPVPSPVVDKPDVTSSSSTSSSSSAATISPVKAVTVAPSLARVAEPSSSSESAKKPRTMVDKSRCAHCQKKVGLTAIECRCGNVYCGAHRMAEKHACTFDFKSFGRSFIEKTNERVVAESLVDKL